MAKAKRKRLLPNDLPLDYADMSKRDQMKALSELSRGVTRKKRESKPSQASTPEEIKASGMRRDLSLLDAGASDVVYLSELEDLLKFDWEASNLKRQDVVVIFGANEGNVSTGTNKLNAGQALAAFRLKEAGFTVIGVPTRSGGRAGQKIGYLMDGMLEAEPRWRALMSEQIAKIKQAKDAGKVVIFPRKGVGTGYASLREKAPKIALKLDEALVKLGIDNATGLSEEDFIKFSGEVSARPTPTSSPMAPAPDIQKGMRGEDAFYYHYTEAGNGDLIAGGAIKPDADGRIYFFDTLEAVNEEIFNEISTHRALEGKDTSDGYDIVAIPRSDFDVYNPKPDMASPDSSAMYVEPRAEIRISDPYVMYSGKNEFEKPTPRSKIPQKISEMAAPAAAPKASEAPASAPAPRTVGIEFIESDSTDYAVRTRINASQSDFTIAYASDHTSLGEKATQREVANAKREIYKFGVTFANDVDRANRLATLVERYNGQEVEINIAGNGEYQKGMPSTQFLTEEIAKDLAFLQKKGVGIIAIRSGGQTGADEAGVKAAVKLGIPAKVVAPKTWKFRTGTAGGAKTDRTGKEAFLARFEGIATTVGTPAPTPVAPVAAPTGRKIQTTAAAPVARVPVQTANSRLNAGAVPNNIYSSAGKNVAGMAPFERGLRAALTNPTNDIVPYIDPKTGYKGAQDSFSLGNIRKKYPVVFQGKIFPSAEHAFFYMSNELRLPKSGDTESVYEAKLNTMQEKMMSEVIAEKLRQHPELIAGIDKIAAGQEISGEEWIAKQSHYTGKADGRRESHWTGDGLNSGFIRALSLAYSSAKKQPESVPFKPDGTGPVAETDKIVHKMMIEWSQDRNNWRFFQPIDRYKSFRSKQIYYVSGNIQDAAESSAAILARAGMAKTEEQKIMLEKQAKEVLASEGIETSIVKSWERMIELSIGQVKGGQNKARLRRTIGAAAPFGIYYDSPIKNKLAQLDGKVKGGSIQEIISDIAAKNGVDLSESGARVATSTNLDTDVFPSAMDLEKTMRKFVMSMRALIKAKTKIEAAKIPEGSRFRRATLSDADAKKLAVVIAKISAIFKEYSDPSLRVESRLMNRFGSEAGRGSLSAGAQLASELVRRGENLTEERIREISKMTRNRVEAIARASGIDLGNISQGGRVFNRPLHQELGHSTPEQRFIDSLSDEDGVSGKKFQASVEESYGFRGAPGQDKKKIAKVGKAIATTMRYFPALAERVVPTPSGFTRSARGVGKPIFSLPGGYSKEFTPEGVESIREAIGRESLATEAFAEGNFKDRVVMIKLGNLLKSNLLVPKSNFNTFDSLMKPYLTKEFDLEKRRAAKVEKLVGPLAKITEIDQNKIDPLTIAEKYREDPTAIDAENLIRRLNSIEIAIDYGTAQKMGVLDARGRSAPNLYAQLAVGIISPQTYVSSKVRVLPGGAVISTDPAYIEAYGYPKVLPYVVVPNTGWRTSKDPKGQFTLREVVVPDRGVESPSSPMVPIKSGGDKAMEVNYRRDALLSATKANMAFEDRAALKESGLSKGREASPELDRKARLDFIIDQVDILAETPSSWTSKEMFDTTMAALKENMTPSDFTALTSGSRVALDDITGASRSSRWTLNKNFQQLIMNWQTAEPDYTFKEASARWRSITGGSDSRRVLDYQSLSLVSVRSGDTTRYVSPLSDEAVKAYLDGKVLNEVSTDGNFATRSKPVLVRRSTDIDAAYPVIFAGERSRAIDDLLIATDDIARVAYQLSYALGYGTDMLPGNYKSDTTGAMTDLVRTVDVKPGEKVDIGDDTIAAAARTMATLIDSELSLFSRQFNARIDLTTSSGRPILPNFQGDANVQLASLKALDTKNKYKENRRLISEIQALDSDAAMTGALPDEIAAAKSSLQQRFDRNVVFNVEEITKPGTTLTLRPGAQFANQPNDPGVTVKPGMGVTGDPLEELSIRFAEVMLGNEDPRALRAVFGQGKVLDLFNEQPADVVAEIVKLAWQIHGENATPDLAKHITFNYDGREYYGTMGVGPDGRPVFVGQPENTNERFLPAENPLQSEPSPTQDTAARRASIAYEEKGARLGRDTNRLDRLRSEDRARTVVVRKNSQWNAISPVVAAKFGEMDAAKLDAFIRLIVQDLLREYVGPDGKPVSYDDVIAKLDFADLVKNGPFTIAHRLFDHGIKGNFKDIEEFIRYTQEARDPVGTVELGGSQARDIGIDPETGQLIIGGEDDPLDAVDTKTKSEINTEDRATKVAPETVSLDEQRGYYPEVGSTEHDTMMAYEQSKMLSGMGMPWTRALSDIGRPLREAPGSMKAFHGRGGFGAGFAADAAYMAWKGYLDPTTLAVSAGFNSINFLPMKYAPKVGLIGAAANVGLTAVTGGDMGRAAMMTIGGLIGGAVGAFGGGFGAIGGSFAGSEVADYIWSDVFGNKNKRNDQLLPSLNPTPTKQIKISPHFGP